VEVAVANAGEIDLDRDIVGPQIPPVEMHWSQWLVGRVGAPSGGWRRHS
jgi:hypothetical protein